MKSGIYRIVNLFNGKFYIGSAIDIERRKKEHFNQLNKNKHYNIHLQCAYNKYGEQNFIFEVLEKCQPNTCVEREQYYIDLYDATNINKGYNIAPNAGSMLGFKFSEESLKRMSESHIGIKDSEETKRKKIAKLTGRPVSDETREKMRKINVGKKMSKESCLKISEAGKGRKMSDNHKEAISRGRDEFNKNHPSRIKVNQYTKDGIFIKTHDSLKLAAIATNAKPSHVSRCVLGIRRTTRGFIFKYANI